MTFWNLPGTGTPDFLLETYLREVELAKYDFFIIISSSRFKFNEAVLAHKIKEIGKNFYFVRSKVDSDLYNEEKSKPRSFKKKRVLQQIRDNCLANPSDIGVPNPHIFLISKFDLADYDFPSLEETLLEEHPAHKCHNFALLLPGLSEAATEVKRDFLTEKLWLEALKSAAFAFIPIVPTIIGFDLPEQEMCLELYRSYFGLDDKSINEIAQNLRVSVQEIMSSIKSLNFWLLVKGDIIPAKATKSAETFCSVNGGILSSAFQFFKTCFLRMKFLNTVADDAKILLHKTLEASSQREWSGDGIMSKWRKIAPQILCSLWVDFLPLKPQVTSS